MSKLSAKFFTILLMISFNCIFVKGLETSFLHTAIIALNILSNFHPGIGSTLFQASDSTLRNEFTNISKIEDVCLTEICNYTATVILEKMDFKVDPCNNFYRFACGSFLNSTNIPDDKAEVNIFSLVEDEVNKKLKVIMENSTLSNESNSSKIVKDLYKICMDEARIEREGLEPLKEILENIGGWPVLAGKNWNDSEFNWINMTYKLMSLGYEVDSLMKVSLGLDPRNNTRMLLNLDEGSMAKFLDNITWSDYGEHMYRILEIFKAVRAEEMTRIQEELIYAWMFEMELFNISIPLEQRNNHSLFNNLMTISELNVKYPFVPWREYFGRFFPSDIQINDTETVIVKVPIFIEKLEKLLNKTSKRTLANYMIWKVVEKSLPYLNKKIRNETNFFSSLFSGVEKTLPRWEKCVEFVVDHVPTAVDALYVRHHVDDKMKEKAEGMVREIGRQLKKNLQKISWIDDYTRKNALEKLELMSSLIAFPDALLKDDYDLEQFYGMIEISTNNFLVSHLNVSSLIRQRGMSLLRSYLDKESIGFRVAKVSALHIYPLNTLLFSAGILQGFFFDSHRPMYVNFGAIGSIIGHEITHGLDNQGRQFDKEGKLVDWWDPITAEKYYQKIQCVINQYGNYTVQDIGENVNGFLTQGENIADIGGIKMAYLAYKDWSERNGPEPKVRGLNYTSSQMYWISTASLWCSKERPSALENALSNDVHSPKEFRVIGSLSNIREFADDFNCPLGSKMNPKEKCDLW